MIYGTRTITSTNMSSVNSGVTILIVAFVLAIIGAVLTFILFLNKENEKKYTGFTKTLYNFLQFNTLCIDSILKFTYLFLAIFITILSFGAITSSFISFLIVLIGGNLMLRICYELTMVVILIHRNVRDINNNTKK